MVVGGEVVMGWSEDEACVARGSVSAQIWGFMGFSSFFVSLLELFWKGEGEGNERSTRIRTSFAVRVCGDGG